MAKNAKSMSEEALGNVSGGVVAKGEAVSNSKDETAKVDHLLLKGSDGKVYGRYPNTDQGYKDMKAAAERMNINLGSALKYNDGSYDSGKGVYNLS